MRMFRKYLVSLFAAMTVSAVVPAWALAPTEVDQLLVEGTSGGRVAVDGDTAVVGAAFADEGHGFRSGAAHVFIRHGGVWARQAKLLADDGGERQGFGDAVAIDGDTIVVGKDAFETTKTVHVFTRTGGTWSREAKLTANNVGCAFGNWIAIDGDTLVLGACAPRGAQNPDPGAAYVFRRSGGVWTQQAKLMADQPDPDDAFGISVALDGNTAMISAAGDDGGRGSAYVFTTSGAAWTQQAKLTADQRDPGDSFGTSITLDGDTAVISALGDDGGRGSAYVFTTSGAAWTQQAKLSASDGAADDRFGASVALDGNTAVIGAETDGDQGYQSGSAYVFTRNNQGWAQRAKLLASSGLSGDSFGGAVAVSGDTALVATALSSPTYVFSLTPDARLFSPGDVNADGVADLVVVTPEDEVIVKDLAGSPVNQFSFDGPGEVVDVAAMADNNANAAAELVALGWVPQMPLSAQVRDLLTGETLSTVQFDPSDTSFDLAPVVDQTGNGIPDLAVVSRDGSQNQVRLQIKDAVDAQAVNTMTLSSYLRPEELEIFPDLNTNGVPELAVLSDNSDPNRSDPIEIGDPASGNVVRQIWLGNGWSVRQQAVIADLNGNGAREVAVLRVKSGAVNVLLRDTLSGAWLGSTGFDPNFPPVGLVVIPDVNGNGTDELVVFGQRSDGANHAVVKDSATGAVLNRIWFDRNAVSQDVTTMADTNGNGVAELVLLGHRARDDTLWAIVKDAATGERLARVRF